MTDDQLTKLRSLAEAAQGSCAHCERRIGSCIGRYGDEATTAVACDNCCGHGNEDGRCEPLGSVLAAALPALLSEVERLRTDRDSYANSDFERQLSDARSQFAIVERERNELRAAINAYVDACARLTPAEASRRLAECQRLAKEAP